MSWQQPHVPQAAQPAMMGPSPTYQWTGRSPNPPCNTQSTMQEDYPALQQVRVTKKDRALQPTARGPASPTSALTVVSPATTEGGTEPI